MSSLIWVHTVCYIDVLNGPADDTEQTTFSRDIIAAHNMDQHARIHKVFSEGVHFFFSK